MPVRVRSRGSFKNTRRFLTKASDLKNMKALEKYAIMGANALAMATPERTGKTAQSWGYEIAYNSGSAKINWVNSNTNKGENVAVLIQYGHGTGTGGYVVGIDYINPALRPVFEEIADKLWNEVTNA